MPDEDHHTHQHQRASPGNDARRVLITAGPTHEPIDAVRAIVNRSSGRLGVALAGEAAERGHSVTLLLGPTSPHEIHPSVRALRFQTTRDLRELLEQTQHEADVLIMAAAVADYRVENPDTRSKIKRNPAGELTLRLIPSPDLLAACAKRRTPGQVLVGFALEPSDRLIESARAKLDRKGIDAIIANPLETMDAEDINAAWITSPALGGALEHTPGPITKREFAPWLLDRIEQLLQ